MASRMKRTAAFGAAILIFACVASSLQALDVHDLLSGTWFISIGLDRKDSVFFSRFPADAPGKFYLRRFAYPSFYLDRREGDSLTIYLHPKAKTTRLKFEPPGSYFERDLGPVTVRYTRVGGGDPALADSPNADPYVGEWTTASPPVGVSIRPIEASRWLLVMYFPGDPDCAIPRGYYPLYEAADGVYRSSAVFPDSGVELSYDPKLDTLMLRPLFHSEEFPQELYDPVRIWKERR